MQILEVKECSIETTRKSKDELQVQKCLEVRQLNCRPESVLV